MHPLAGRFDIVLARAILHHLSDKEAAALFGTARRHLRKGGVLVTYDPVYVPDQSPIARYIISRDRGQHVRTPEEYAGLAAEEFSSIEANVVRGLSKLPYTHFIMQCVK